MNEADMTNKINDLQSLHSEIARGVERVGVVRIG